MGVFIVSDVGTQAGDWALALEAVTITSTDGTLHPIYAGEPNATATLNCVAPGVTNYGFTTDYYPDRSAATQETTTYYHADHLGSARLLTSGWGWPLWQGTFMPFGHEVSPQITVNRYKFAQLERDPSSEVGGLDGLDHAEARHYFIPGGRWLSPDPAGLAAADPTNPQSWNRYAYVGNDPINYGDRQGTKREWREAQGEGGGGGAGGGPDERLVFRPGIPGAMTGFATASEFDLMNIPIKMYGWKLGFVEFSGQHTGPDPNIDGLSFPFEVNGFSVETRIGDLRWHWAELGTIGTAFDLLSVSCMLNCGTEANEAFKRTYANRPPQHIVSTQPKPPKPSDQNATATDVYQWCAIAMFVQSGAPALATPANPEFVYADIYKSEGGTQRYVKSQTLNPATANRGLGYMGALAWAGNYGACVAAGLTYVK